MNKELKESLKTAIANAEVANEGLASARDAIQTEFDAMSEKVQEGDKGQKLMEWVNALEEAENTISDALDQLKMAGD